MRNIRGNDTRGVLSLFPHAAEHAFGTMNQETRDFVVIIHRISSKVIRQISVDERIFGKVTLCHHFSKSSRLFQEPFTLVLDS